MRNFTESSDQADPLARDVTAGNYVRDNTESYNQVATLKRNTADLEPGLVELTIERPPAVVSVVNDTNTRISHAIQADSSMCNVIDLVTQAVSSARDAVIGGRVTGMSPAVSAYLRAGSPSVFKLECTP